MLLNNKANFYIYLTVILAESVQGFANRPILSITIKFYKKLEHRCYHHLSRVKIPIKNI